MEPGRNPHSRRVRTDERPAQGGHPPDVEPEPGAFVEGDIIAGKYEVTETLGGAGMASVVAARHLELDERVVVKVLRSECLAHADLVTRFDGEARASLKIESDHVARVLEVGTMPNGAPFIAMEYLDGEDLGTVLREGGRAPIDCASEFLLQACDALASAHAIGIVHRDVRPENLFVVRSDQGLDAIKVRDFGISNLALTASAFDNSGPNAKPITLTGTPSYMSPELIRVSVDADSRTDIWSLGCVLYELLTGHTPFEAPSVTMLTAMILERPAPLLRARRSDLPAEVEALVARCLEKDPSRRFQTVSELAAALFPFAPRRARLSFERCGYLLKNAGLPPPALKRSSAPPRSSGRPGATASGKAASTPPNGRPNTTPPRKRSSAPPSNGSRPTTPPRKRSSGPPRNSGPPNTTMTLPIADEAATGTNAELEGSPATSGIKRRSKVWGVAGVCVMIVAAAFALHQFHVMELLTGTQAVATAALGAMPPPTATVPSVAPVDTPATPSGLDALETSSQAGAGASSPKAKPPRKSHKQRPQAGTPQEIDVGF